VGECVSSSPRRGSQSSTPATLWLFNLLHREAQRSPRRQQEILLTEVRALAVQDLRGWANQILAEPAREVVVVVAGIPVPIKAPASGPTATASLPRR